MDLFKLYHNTNFPGSYSGVRNFYKEVKNLFPDITLKEIKDFLKSQDTYTFHKRNKKAKEISPDASL